MQLNYCNIIKKLILIFPIVFTSCQGDFLDTSPNTSIDQANAFSTPEKILAQVNGLYGQLQNQNLYGGRFIVFNEQRGDEFGQNDGNAATGSAVWNQNVASTNEYINNVWAVAYSTINAANILIKKLKETQIISDSLSRHYIAEAKFVRAVSYLCLVQTYAKPFNLDKTALGVPIRLQAITSEGYNDLARSSVEEVYKQILSDLDEAEKDLPLAYSTPLLNVSRAHKSSAVDLKLRVFLNQSDFPGHVFEASKLVLNTVPFQYIAPGISHSLEPFVANLYTGSYVGPEAIFSIPFANSNTETPASQYSLAYNYLGQPIIFLAGAGIVSDSAFINSEDGRSKLVGINQAKLKVLKKFAITTAPFRDYIPVVRYAEVLLNYAEASAQLGDLNLAFNLLQAVRHRSNPNYQFSADVASSKENLISAILRERRIEFLGEGLRLQDLQRLVKPLPAKTGSIGTAPEVLPNAKNYIWPIPSAELSTNKLCLPN